MAALFISRAARLADLRAALHTKSTTLSNLPAGSRSHALLLGECEAITEQIERLLAAGTTLSPVAVVGLLTLAAFGVVLFLTH